MRPLTGHLMMAACVVIISLNASAEPVKVARYNGPDENRVNIAILGDGYTRAELGKYAEDVEALLTRFFESTPFKEYAAYFNAYRVDVTSEESGADHPARGDYRNTALGAYYDCENIKRLICADYSAITDVLNRSLAPIARDIVMVVVNDDEYGGAGGAFAIAYRGEHKAEVMLHEVGHSFGLLGDEYGHGGARCDSSVEPHEVNISRESTRDSSKWSYWIETGTPVPARNAEPSVVSTYEGGKYCASGLYRPTFASKMRQLGKPFEQINSEQIIRRIYNIVSPIDAACPTTARVKPPRCEPVTFSVRTPGDRQNLAGRIKTRWRINGEVTTTGRSMTVDSCRLPIGSHQIEVEAWDPTPGVRQDPEGALSARLRWNLETRLDSVNPNHTLPMVVSASHSGTQGLIRVINHSDRAGTVQIHATDDAGRHAGPISLSLEAGASVQLSSRNLEAGASWKGLSGGIGQGEGSWRLTLETELDIEALAYFRGAVGVITSAHEVAAQAGSMRYLVPLFNPARNRARHSLLRLTNPGNDVAQIVVSAWDDQGERAQGGEVQLAIPPRETRTLSAKMLERGDASFAGRWGEGAGKWRLLVSADHPIRVLSLLQGSDGNLSNLSSTSVVSDPAECAAMSRWLGSNQPRPEHTLPLVVSASHSGTQGFVRVINHSDHAGTVRIHATDDSGRRTGPVSLSLEGGASVQLSSRELEGGAPWKGLSDGIGRGKGSWRLTLDTELDIEPLAYFRGAVGVITSAHDVAAQTSSMRYHVPFFNPGTNHVRRSLLRVGNPGDTAVEIVIGAWDDRGEQAPDGNVRLTIPAGQTRTLSAQTLEQGGPDVGGHFGDGTGKWRLLVSANHPIQVVSLLQAPDGNLSNLSR